MNPERIVHLAEITNYGGHTLYLVGSILLSSNWTA